MFMVLISDLTSFHYIRIMSEETPDLTAVSAQHMLDTWKDLATCEHIFTKARFEASKRYYEAVWYVFYGKHRDLLRNANPLLAEKAGQLLQESMDLLRECAYDKQYGYAVQLEAASCYEDAVKRYHDYIATVEVIV